MSKAAKTKMKDAMAEAERINEAFRAAAREMYEREGTLEIDENATVSISEDGGAYVQAWVWVYDKDAGLNQDENEE